MGSPMNCLTYRASSHTSSNAALNHILPAMFIQLFLFLARYNRIIIGRAYCRFPAHSTPWGRTGRCGRKLSTHVVSCCPGYRSCSRSCLGRVCALYTIMYCRHALGHATARRGRSRHDTRIYTRGSTREDRGGSGGRGGDASSGAMRKEKR
jgi:hypothetical protein